MNRLLLENNKGINYYSVNAYNHPDKKYSTQTHVVFKIHILRYIYFS